jgi:hypothetical protein
MKKNVFLLFSKDDETNTELKGLIQNVENFEHFKITQKDYFRLDDTTKQNILDCDIFICCLSRKFSDSKLIDTVKFASYITRRKINAFYLDNNIKRCLPKVEDQRFFEYRTVKFSSLDQIVKVNICIIYPLG